MGEPSAAHSDQGFGVHHRTTHAHKGAESKALEHAHHTSSPGDKRRQGRRLCGIG
jgi:hypothetical protein